MSNVYPLFEAKDSGGSRLIGIFSTSKKGKDRLRKIYQDLESKGKLDEVDVWLEEWPIDILCNRFNISVEATLDYINNE